MVYKHVEYYHQHTWWRYNGIWARWDGRWTFGKYYDFDGQFVPVPLVEDQGTLIRIIGPDNKTIVYAAESRGASGWREIKTAYGKTIQ